MSPPFVRPVRVRSFTHSGALLADPQTKCATAPSTDVTPAHGSCANEAGTGRGSHPVRGGPANSGWAAGAGDRRPTRAFQRNLRTQDRFRAIFSLYWTGVSTPGAYPGSGLNTGW